MIADTGYEIPASVVVTPASHPEVRTLKRTQSRLFGESPELARRCGLLSADRGYDAVR